jgi:hypothetical protein
MATATQRRHAAIDELVERALDSLAGAPAGLVEIATMTGVSMMTVSWSIKRLERKSAVIRSLRSFRTDTRHTETVSTYISSKFIGVGLTKLPAWLMPEVPAVVYAARTIPGRCGFLLVDEGQA